MTAAGVAPSGGRDLAMPATAPRAARPSQRMERRPLTRMLALALLLAGSEVSCATGDDATAGGTGGTGAAGGTTDPAGGGGAGATGGGAGATGGGGTADPGCQSDAEC